MVQLAIAVPVGDVALVGESLHHLVQVDELLCRLGRAGVTGGCLCERHQVGSDDTIRGRQRGGRVSLRGLSAGRQSLGHLGEGAS